MKKLNVLIAGAVLVSCTKKEKVSWETQEQSRAQAIENAEYNVRKFRQKFMPDSKILMRGDSTISADCMQGDGWATVDLELPDGTTQGLKCSTVSATIGCMKKEDFAKRDYAQQDGQCNNDLPFPLPKVVK